MEQAFSFQFTSLDPDRLCPQVSRALEKRAELISRQKCPKMWALTDRLNSVEKVPQAVRENRKKRRGFLGIWNWMLGVFLLIPGLLDPQTLWIPLLVGAAGFGVGVVTLWRNRRTLLGILSLIKGVVLCMGALGNPAELGRLLALGAAGVIIGLAALLTRKQEKENPFDRAARKLVEEKSGLKGLEQVRCSFSSEGMTVCREGTGEAAHTTPYSSFVFVLETEDLLLPIYHDCVIILQKKDLLAGTILQLREFLSQQTQYVFVPEQQEAPLKEAT